MDKVYFIKLVTGEGILAKVKAIASDTIRVVDPMELTFQETGDGRSVIYLNRYSQFMMSRDVSFDRSHVIHASLASELGTDYYHRSVLYSEAKLDESFDECLKGAVSHVTMLCDESTAKPSPSAKREEMTVMTEDGPVTLH